MSRPLSVLFLCTHNTARSIIAEALLAKLGKGRFQACSAGSSPRASGEPNPLALQVLAEAGFPTDGLHSKGWDEFLREGGAAVDIVITVCDDAQESCPVFPGRPATAHWGYADPSAGDAPQELKLAAFRKTLIQMKHRIELLVSLPDAALERMAIEQSVRALASR